VPSQEDPQAAIDVLVERGYGACEVDFEGGFWMDWDYADRLGELARGAGIPSRSTRRSRPPRPRGEEQEVPRGGGMLDRTAGVAVACGAEIVVFHPGFLLGRERDEAIAAVANQLGDLREPLEGKDRAVPCGVEIIGRGRELSSRLTV
jgi:sugar phosphate isomerase/epimerase